MPEWLNQILTSPGPVPSIRWACVKLTDSGLCQRWKRVWWANLGLRPPDWQRCANCEVCWRLVSSEGNFEGSAYCLMCLLWKNFTGPHRALSSTPLRTFGVNWTELEIVRHAIPSLCLTSWMLHGMNECETVGATPYESVYLWMQCHGQALTFCIFMLCLKWSSYVAVGSKVGLITKNSLKKYSDRFRNLGFWIIR